MKKKIDRYLFIIILCALVLLWIIPTGFENPTLRRDIIIHKARVTEVDNSDVESISATMLGTQRLQVVALEGEFKGDTLNSFNLLVGDRSRDKLFCVGDRIVAISRMDPTHTSIIDCRAEEYHRTGLIWLLVLSFALCLVWFAGWTGVKAALSFIFTALTLWKVLIPALLKGYSPILVAVGVVFSTTLVVVLLVGGVSRKGFVALGGSTAGVGATAILALIFGHLFKIPGTVMPYAESLLYAGYSDLNFSQIFISCIFISSAGAVMDVAMDIASAQDELISNAPQLSARELIRSGLNVAAPVVGSMTTTLLFAYSGSLTFVFMAFMAQGAPMESIINRAYISAEILHTLVGSFGLVLVAPLTALIGGYIYTHPKR